MMSGAQFRDVRAQLGLSQASVAQKLDVSVATIQKIERTEEAIRYKYERGITALVVANPVAMFSEPVSAPERAYHPPAQSEALAAYNAGVAALATLYRHAKAAGASPSGRPRMTALDVLERNDAAAEAKKEIVRRKQRRAQYEAELINARKVRELQALWSRWQAAGQHQAILDAAVQLQHAADWDEPWNRRVSDFVSYYINVRVILSPSDPQWAALFSDPEPVE